MLQDWPGCWECDVDHCFCVDIDLRVQAPISCFVCGTSNAVVACASQRARPRDALTDQRRLDRAYRMKRADVIDNKNIQAGDVVIGLESYGKATYESEYNGGMGSNGLTSARHDVFSKYLAEKFPESYDASVPKDLVYSGTRKLTDKVEGCELDAGKLVLSATRTYAPIIKKVLDKHRKDIHGIIHCSGGAQTKALHFIENVHVVKDNMFPVPPLFDMIHKESGTDWKEMYKVFNMGHRMEIYCAAEHAQSIIDISQSFNVKAQIVGKCEPLDGKKVTIKSEFGEFVYDTA